MVVLTSTILSYTTFITVRKVEIIMLGQQQQQQQQKQNRILLTDVAQSNQRDDPRLN